MASDDAAGVLALQRLCRNPRMPADVLAVEGGTECFGLLDQLSGVHRLVVLDCIDVGVRPGALLRLSGETLASLPIARSAHERGLADLLAALRLLNSLPEEIVLLGIQPACVEIGLSLSAPVAEALDGLVAAALVEIDRMNASWAPVTRAASSAV
jgi:hydrogenase maturation protease